MSERNFEGGSVAEAAIRACEALGTTRASLQYRIVSENGEGLERRVEIAATVPAAGAQPAADRRPARPPRGESAGDGGTRRRPGSRREPGVGGGRERAATGARRPREDRAHAPDAEGRHGRGSSGGDQRRGRSGGDQRRGFAPQPAAAGRPDSGVDALLQLDGQAEPVVRPPIQPTGERATRALQVIVDLVRLMGLDVAAQLSQENDEELWVDIGGPDAQRVIGRRGEVLLALQFVANRILDQGDSEAEPVNQILICDAGNYRGRRLAALEALARELGDRALAENKAVRLSPMSAHDRRVFHLALKDFGGLTTRSEGDGLMRSLLIIPASQVA